MKRWGAGKRVKIFLGSFLCFSIFVVILFLIFAVEGFWENQRIEREMAEASVSIIGGADGPTSVFIAGKISAPGKAMTILGIAVGFFCRLLSGIRERV